MSQIIYKKGKKRDEHGFIYQFLRILSTKRNLTQINNCVLDQASHVQIFKMIKIDWKS